MAAASLIMATGELCGQGFLIADTTRRDIVFDFAGQNLYISTTSGLVKTFHLSTRTFGMTYNLGGSLNGLDIARDNSFLLVAQGTIGVSQGRFQRVNLASGMITNINYTLAFGEGGAWDVAIASNGLALVTTQYDGSGFTPLRQIDLSTTTITTRTDAPEPGGEVTQNTQIHRSTDGTRLFFMESNISSGPVFTYSATSNTFGPNSEPGGYLDFPSGAVNRKGNLIAFRNSGPTPASLNTAPNFGFIQTFNELDSGVAFDATRDVLYGVNSQTDEIIAYSTSTFAELFRIPIGEDVAGNSKMFDSGTLVASADGRWLALETDSGIRLFEVPKIIHSTDFNLDGKADYVLFNASTRRTAIWYLNNNAFSSSAFGPTLPAGWNLVAVGDFNLDGKPDYVLFDASTRQTAVWYLNNNAFISGALGPTLPAGWNLVAVGDFNRDGKPDYLLVNSNTRQTSVWYLNNNAYLSGGGGPVVVAGYSLTGAADFDRDYQRDYVLFDATTGRTAIWYLNNRALVAGAYGPTLPAGWSLLKP